MVIEHLWDICGGVQIIQIVKKNGFLVMGGTRFI